MGRNWKHALLAWPLILAIGLSDSSIHAESASPACFFKEELSSTNPKVTYDTPHFLFNGRRFPIDVLSIAEDSLYQKNITCLRYAVENTGSDTILLFFWHLISKLDTIDLRPGPENRWEIDLRVPSLPAVPWPTVIKAFRSEVNTIAVQPVKKAELSEPNPYFHFERSAILDPAAARAIETHQIPDVEVAVVEPTADPFERAPPVAAMLLTSS